MLDRSDTETEQYPLGLSWEHTPVPLHVPCLLLVEKFLSQEFHEQLRVPSPHFSNYIGMAIRSGDYFQASHPLTRMPHNPAPKAILYC